MPQRISHIAAIDKLPQVGATIFSVMSQLAAEVGAINLSQGFPDFPLDPVLVDLAATAMRSGHDQYAPMPGLPMLREAIAAKVQRTRKVGYDPATEITVTAGATQAIFTCMGALVRPGDEVIIIDPAYDCYAPAVRLFGGVPVHVQLDRQMCFDGDAVAAAITPRTRLLMINTPHNPGGGILGAADMDRIAAMLDGTDIVLISDEVYEHIIFDGEPHASAMLHPGLRERAFVLFSFGKTYHATGWKIGHALAPVPLMQLFRKVHQFNVFSVNTPMQHALAAYMLQEPDHEGLAPFYQRKRDRFREGLAASRFRLLPCAGSYFQLADFSDISQEDDVAFAHRLAREHGVAAIPLSPFYEKAPEDLRVLRFCFAKQDATLDAAITKLCLV
jgi:methionine transaminase